MDEKLDLTAFKKATISFKAILDRHNKEPNDDAVHDACIKRFEYCYELSKKILIRHLKNMGEDDVDNMVLEDVIRLGAKKGLLLHSWDVWNDYRNSRNSTSHGYDENMAKEILEQIPAFLVELEYLCEKLVDFYETKI